jgi:hypothetical protein
MFTINTTIIWRRIFLIFKITSATSFGHLLVVTTSETKKKLVNCIAFHYLTEKTWLQFLTTYINTMYIFVFDMK